ncbi:MAG: hypothetical protein MJ208_01270 [Bacilli bacterium]|nr:hypothetical protein [Bacilli bacterium]
MKKGLPLAGVLLSSLGLSLCLSCNNEQSCSISFECVHCVCIMRDKYEASFNIEFGYQLLEENIEVTNNGQLDNDCWTFMYQSNIINSFKIKPNVSGDIKVKINCTEKKPREYGLAIDVPAVDQTSIKFFPTQKDIHYIEDWQRIAFAIREDENLNFSFAAANGKTLPTNIGMWMNGRYSREGVEVNFKYSEDLKSCYVTVPYFVVRDNLQFRLK